MVNKDAQEALSECWKDVKKVRLAICDSTKSSARHLTLYALIRCCGTIETTFKSIVADYACKSTCARTTAYIDKFIRNSSKNPTIDNINTLLKSFDKQWNTDLKSKIKGDPKGRQIKDSLKTLTDSRNAFAHGMNVNITLSDVRKHYRNACRLIFHIDTIIK